MSKATKMHFQQLAVRREYIGKEKLLPETGNELKEEKYAIVKLLISIKYSWPTIDILRGFHQLING